MNITRFGFGEQSAIAGAYAKMYAPKRMTESINKVNHNCRQLCESQKSINESDDAWMGVDGARLIWHGEWADPEIQYGDALINYYDVEDMLLTEYREEHPEDRNDDGFDAWMEENTDSVRSALDILASNEETENAEEELGESCCRGKKCGTFKKHCPPKKTGSKLGARKMLPFEKRDKKPTAKKYTPPTKKVAESAPITRGFCIVDGDKTLCTNDMNESYFSKSGITGETRIYESAVSALKDIKKVNARRKPNKKYCIRKCQCVGESFQFIENGSAVNENRKIDEAGGWLGGLVDAAGGALKSGVNAIGNTLNTGADAVGGVYNATKNLASNVKKGNAMGAVTGLAKDIGSMAMKTAGGAANVANQAVADATGFNAKKSLGDFMQPKQPPQQSNPQYDAADDAVGYRTAKNPSDEYKLYQSKQPQKVPSTAKAPTTSEEYASAANNMQNLPQPPQQQQTQQPQQQQPQPPQQPQQPNAEVEDTPTSEDYAELGNNLANMPDGVPDDNNAWNSKLQNDVDKTVAEVGSGNATNDNRNLDQKLADMRTARMFNASMTNDKMLTKEEVQQIDAQYNAKKKQLEDEYYKKMQELNTYYNK